MDFNRRAGTYDKVGNMEFYSNTINRVLEYASPKKTDMVLDIGTGTGEIALKLAPHVKKSMGIDPSEKMLQKAIKKSSEMGLNNTEFIRGSFSEYSFDIKFDLITSTFAFHHLNDTEKRTALNKMKEYLNVGGKIIIGDVVWAFDPARNPEKYSVIKKIVEDYGSAHGFDFSVESEHHHIPKFEDISNLFDECGFICLKEQIPPLIGIFCANKK